ncbi:MAG: hypothetical protein KJ646_02165 [Nanoarchaeota archaeon]|nr:hypothetical protein [Nanoarchaeota archaeon]MBU4116945.1 hypothetical protein [Nanoarchaeota archaeon]
MVKKHLCVMKNSMDMKFLLNKSNTKAISAVIATVILIALTVAVISIVWVVVNNLVTTELEGAQSCYGVFDKVTINNRYTCYDSSDPSSDKFQFSISIGDIPVDEVLVSISGEGQSKSFKITNNATTIENVENYPAGTLQIKLPGINSGLTYIYDLTAGGFSTSPDKIEIAPIVNKKQCGVSDSLSDIENCLLLS